MVLLALVCPGGIFSTPQVTSCTSVFLTSSCALETPSGGPFKFPVAKSPLTPSKAEPTWGGEVERLGLVIFKTLPRCF